MSRCINVLRAALAAVGSVVEAVLPRDHTDERARANPAGSQTAAAGTAAKRSHPALLPAGVGPPNHELSELLYEAASWIEGSTTMSLRLAGSRALITDLRDAAAQMHAVETE